MKIFLLVLGVALIIAGVASAAQTFLIVVGLVLIVIGLLRGAYWS